MKSTTSPSLLPAISCSRIWRRRSTASSAFDSASDWFWHTRQRSSCDSAATRFSRSGGVSENAFPPREAARARTHRILFTRQLPDEGENLLRQDLAQKILPLVGQLS